MLTSSARPVIIPPTATPALARALNAASGSPLAKAEAALNIPFPTSMPTLKPENNC